MKKSEKREGNRTKRSLRLVALILTAVMLLSTAALAVEGDGEAGEASVSVREADAEEIGIDRDLIYLEDAARVPEEEPPYNDDEDVRILIKLKEDGALAAGYSSEGITENIRAGEYMDRLNSVQDEIAESISDDVVTDGSFEYLRSYAMITNALEANAKYGDLEVIDAYLRENYGDVFEDIYTVPQMDIESVTGGDYDTQTYSASTMVGAPNAWKNGYSGAGTLVAVIDTGLDLDHPSFDPDAFMYSLNELEAMTDANYKSKLLTREGLEAKLTDLHAYTDYSANRDRSESPRTLEVGDVYRNAKVPFGYNYVDDDLNIGHDQDDAGDHGTHVSGIAVANKYVEEENDAGGVHYEPQEHNVCGIAPDAQLVVMKVFGAGGRANLMDTLPAIEDAIALGCDSINLSLGSTAPGKSYDTSNILDVFSTMVNSGSLVVFSSGNNGYWPQHNVANSQGLDYAEDISMMTGGTSGSYTNSFTVASDTNTTITGIGGDFNGYFALVTDGSNASNPEWRTLDTSKDGSGTNINYVFLGDPKNPDDPVKYGGVGSYDDFKESVAGKIVLVSRGGNVNFSVKHMEAFNAEAAGCLVYNNVNETISMTLEGSTATIPCASITLRDMEGILENSKLDENGYYTGTMHIVDNVQSVDNSEGYEMSSFSSWGTTGNLAIKPEITAPGGNIYSSVNDGKYSVMSGTSMSAPSITGQSALVAQYVKESGLENKDKFNTRRALVTSLLMSTAKPLIDPACGVPYSVRQQGAGLANVDAATSTPAYIEMSTEATATANDGRVKAELGDDPGRKGIYTFTFTVHNISKKELTYVLDPYVITPEIIEADGKEFMSTHSMLLNSDVTFIVNGKALTNGKVYDMNGDGTVDISDAARVNDFAAGLGTLTDEQQSIADLDSDGAVTSVDVYLFLKYIDEGASRLDAAELTVPKGGDTEVTVTIKLSESDRKMLGTTSGEGKNPNGAYVEGYIEMHGGVDLSVPFLTFYGNFTEPSMFDRTTFIDSRYNHTDKKSYVSETGNVNYLSVRTPESNVAYILGPNLYADEDTFISERNMVISPTANSLYTVNPTFIRTVDSVHVVISDAETGDTLWQTYASGSEAYYDSSTSSWQNITSAIRLSSLSDLIGGDLGWQGDLKDGTKIKVTVTAAPELYTEPGEGDDGGKVIKKGVADGAKWETELTVDNKVPTIVDTGASGYYWDDENQCGHLTVKVKDNRAVAAILLFNATKTRVLLRKAVDQQELGIESTVELELGSNIKGSKLYLVALDYAGNATEPCEVTRPVTEGGVDDEWDENTFFGLVKRGDITTWNTVDVEDGSTQVESNVNHAINMSRWRTGAYADEKIYAMGTVDGSDPIYGAGYGGKTFLWEMYSDDLKLSSSIGYTWEDKGYTFTDMTFAPSYGRMVISAVYQEKGPRVCLLEPGSNSLALFNLSDAVPENEKIAGITYLYTTEEKADTDKYQMVDHDWFLMVTDMGSVYIAEIYLDRTNYKMDYEKIGSCENIKITNGTDLEKICGSTLVKDAKEGGGIYYLLDGKLYSLAMEQNKDYSDDQDGTLMMTVTAESRGDLDLGESSIFLQLNDKERKPSESEQKNDPWLSESRQEEMSIAVEESGGVDAVRLKLN